MLICKYRAIQKDKKYIQKDVRHVLDMKNHENMQTGMNISPFLFGK